jgi:environmental stress-induced protein Ves
MFRILTAKDDKITSWSGGKTMQIYIYPEDGDFGAGKYDMRISVATVEQKESIYTPLPGVHRTLMLLEGELRLKHQGHHSTHLKPFDQDSFTGDWTTYSFGKVRNFNVMTRSGIATVKHISMDSKRQLQCQEGCFCLIYVAEGQLKFQESVLQSGDSLLYDETIHLEPILKTELCLVVYRKGLNP